MYYALILAAILSDSPPDSGVGLDNCPMAMQALKDVCITLDLWETQEGWGLFSNEIRWAWGEWRCLRDLPPSSDYRRFPDSLTAAALVAFNCDTQLWLEGRAAKSAAADAALAEAKRLRAIWDAVRIATSQTSIHARREALGQLREAIGRDEYHLGRLPEHVPGWVFAPVD